MEEEHDTKSFFVAVRKFYEKSIKKMILKFPSARKIVSRDSLGISKVLSTTSNIRFCFTGQSQRRVHGLYFVTLPNPVEYTAADATKKNPKLIDIGGKLKKWSS